MQAVSAAHKVRGKYSGAVSYLTFATLSVSDTVILCQTD
jgi:hypothetical protein